MLSGNGKDWNQGSGNWRCVPEHQDVDKKEGGSTVEPWPSDWRNGPDVGSHAAVQNSPSSSCCCSYTFFSLSSFDCPFSVLQLYLWLQMMCSPHPALCWALFRHGSRSLLTWCLFSYFSGSERCCSEHWRNLGCILGWVSSLVTYRFAHWFKGKSCLYLTSLTQFWFP